MKYQLEPHHRNTPNEELISDLKQVAAQLAKTAVTIDEYNERGRFHSTTLSRRFGSWFKALDQAGLAKTRNLHISNEQLFTNLADLWTALSRQPKYQDLTSQTSKYSAGTYEKRFGSWRPALEAFVRWADESTSQLAETPPHQRISGHRTSRTINHRLRFLVMRRDNFKCRITGRSPATDPTVILEVDHIMHWDKGGETIMDNLQTLAKEINVGKSNLDMERRV